jgi:hypothetical protein
MRAVVYDTYGSPDVLRWMPRSSGRWLLGWLLFMVGPGLGSGGRREAVDDCRSL